MSYHKLNVPTASFFENQKDGLMICGINWGGSPDNPSEEESASFFSDIRYNNYRYRTKFLKWFELFGHPLQVKEETAGPFERSIVQTNWLSSQSQSMRGKHLPSEYVREWENFEFHVQQLQPKFIIFLSVTMLGTLNSRNCLEKARRLFGPEAPVQILQKDVTSGGKLLKRFRIGIQKFGDIQIVALPHPTGSIGLSDEYIREFAEDISPLLDHYKIVRGFKA